MKNCSKGMVPFLTKEEISELVKDIANQIKNRHGKSPLHFVCPLKGSFIFGTDLTREFENTEVTIDFVKIQSKGNGFIVKKDIESDIRGKSVIILEEIIDAGRSLSFLKSHLSLSIPKSVEVACLLDKPARREIPVAPDYTGKTIDDRFVIGYGMDSDEVGRNCNDIYNFLQ
jgi:hypoxanthine phosphoribosyltransferase